MKSNRSTATKKISNRRARYDYELGDQFVVGIQLSGAETKSLRMGHGNLRGAYATLKDNELWLVNAQITGSSGVNISEDDQRRSRKLLAKRREIEAMASAKQQGLTIVPLELITQGRYIKLRLSLGRGKKRFDKREIIKRRESDRSTQQALRP